MAGHQVEGLCGAQPKLSLVMSSFLCGTPLQHISRPAARKPRIHQLPGRRSCPTFTMAEQRATPTGWHRGLSCSPC